MGVFERILGICTTKKPKDEGCWRHKKGKVEIDWSRAPELHEPCGAIRLEGRGLPERVLIVHGIDGQFHAFRNKCSDMGRRIDPVAGRAAVHCCCLSRSTFDYTGNAISGPANESLKTYCVETKKCKVIISLD